MGFNLSTGQKAFRGFSCHGFRLDQQYFHREHLSDQFPVSCRIAQNRLFLDPPEHMPVALKTRRSDKRLKVKFLDPHSGEVTLSATPVESRIVQQGRKDSLLSCLSCDRLLII